MYTREPTAAPEKIIQNGKPVFGTFLTSPKKLDICDIKHPFTISILPSFLANFRIRANLTFVFSTEKYLGIIDLLDSKYFNFSETVIFDKDTKKKQAYREFSLFRRFIPKNLEHGICVTFKKHRHLKISWNKDKKQTVVNMNMAGDKIRPDFSGELVMNLADDKKAEVFTVRPALIQRRCAASYTYASPVHGNIKNKTENTDLPVSEKKCSAIFNMRRAYYKLRTHEESASATGFTDDKRVSFRISETNYDSSVADKYNENVLFVDNEVTPLPPVKITHPFGINGKWVIQDTENMVDLYFEPETDNRRLNSILVLRADYHTIFGTFEGDLRTRDGEIIHLKGFPGIIQKQYLRM